MDSIEPGQDEPRDSVMSSAVSGAVAGAATGGGAGAAAGAAKAVFTSPAARRGALKALAWFLAPIIVIGGLALLSVSQMTQGLSVMGDELAMDSSGASELVSSGVSGDDVGVIREVAQNTGVPWTVLAAMYRSGSGTTGIDGMTAGPGTTEPAAGGPSSVPSSIPGCTGTGQKSGNDGSQPWVRDVRQYLYNCFQTMDIGGYRRQAGSDHNDGLALDVMISKIETANPKGHTNGEIVASWAQANCAALNCKYIIWEQRIWNAGRAGEGWRKMGDRGGTTANHFDHVHISFKPGTGSYNLTAAPQNMGTGTTYGGGGGSNGGLPGVSEGPGGTSAGNVPAQPSDPSNLCRMNDTARSEGRTDEEWESDKKELRRCLTILGSQLNAELTKQPGYDGEDIAAGGIVRRGGTVEWTSSNDSRMRVRDAYVKALAALPVAGASEQWGAQVFDTAVRWRLGLTASACSAPVQGQTDPTNVMFPTVPAAIGQFKGEQVRNAATIISVGKGLGFSDRDIQIAIMTAMGENNLGADKTGLKPNGDGDMGWFQLRAYVGWHADGKTIDENIAILNDGAYNTKVFFMGHDVGVKAAGGAGPLGYHIPGLKDVKGRDTMDPAQVAHKVQGNAAWTNFVYSKNWGNAQQVFTELMKVATSNGSTAADASAPGATQVPGPDASGGDIGHEAPTSIVVTSSDGDAVNVTETELKNVAAMVAAMKTVQFESEDDRQRAMLIATMTMAVESKWRNLASRAVPESMSLPNDGVVAGDHDSVGLFQQRARTGAWGTAAQLMDPTYASLMFAGANPPGAPANHARGLLQIPNWQTLPLGVAAQKVQVSAFPDRYALWEQASRDVLKAAGGVSVPADPGASCSTQTGVVAASSGTWELGDTYMPFWQSRNGARDGVDPWNFFWGECVSWAAWYVQHTSHTDFTNNWTYQGKKAHFGNGGEWAFEARKVGIPVDETPAVGSIATWYGRGGRYPQPNGRTNYGHVAAVTAVAPDGTITIEQYNVKHHRYSKETGVDPKRFNAYIHFEKAPNNPGVTRPTQGQAGAS